MKPVLFVTGSAPFDRVGPFAALAESEGVQFAFFGGRQKHGPVAETGGAPGAGELFFPHQYVSEGAVLRLAASGRYRAVICGTGGRVALPAAWAGARRAGVPFLLWSALWAHPRSIAHAASWLGLRRLYRSADAVVTYGPHVSAYVAGRGARNVFVAPQAVDNDFWAVRGGPVPEGSWPEGSGCRFLFVGRPAREKGLQVLLPAWRASGLAAPAAALVLVGEGSTPPWVPTGGAVALSEPAWMGAVEPARLRNFYAAADVLVLPSIRTRTFREPWGLVVNEAFNQATAVICSDEVGAAAGGLVRHERNGLVVPAGDVGALAGAMERLAGDTGLRAGFGQQGLVDVQAYSAAAWAGGFSAALKSVSASAGGER